MSSSTRHTSPVFVTATTTASKLIFHKQQRWTCCALSPPTTETTTSPKSVAMPPVVFILGGPGSGKGTQCARLVHDFGYAQVTVGDLLRNEATSGTAEGRKISEIMQAGNIVPSEITMRLLSKALQGAVDVPGVLVDGFPRNLAQAKLFETQLAPCKFVVYFQCEAAEMRRRILTRAHTSGRADDDDIVISARLETYLKETMPVINRYRELGLLREVDSNSGGPDIVYESTKQLFTTEFQDKPM